MSRISELRLIELRTCVGYCRRANTPLVVDEVLCVMVANPLVVPIPLTLLRFMRLGLLFELVRYLYAEPASMDPFLITCYDGPALGVVVDPAITLVIPVLRNFKDGERFFSSAYRCLFSTVMG